MDEPNPYNEPDKWEFFVDVLAWIRKWKKRKRKKLRESLRRSRIRYRRALHLPIDPRDLNEID